MPYSDPVKKAAWRSRELKKRRERRRSRQAAHIAQHGHHTKASRAWPKADLSEIDRAWAAACIDCEGCISLGSYWNKQRGSYNFHVNISLQMTDPAIPRRLHDLCGGSFRHSERVAVKHKSIYAWNLSANGVRWILPQIRQYLMVKGRQADLLIEFLTISKRGVFGRAENDLRAQSIRSEMRDLNQRGIPTAPIGITSEPIKPAQDHSAKGE